MTETGSNDSTETKVLHFEHLQRVTDTFGDSGTGPALTWDTEVSSYKCFKQHRTAGNIKAGWDWPKLSTLTGLVTYRGGSANTRGDRSFHDFLARSSRKSMRVFTMRKFPSTACLSDWPGYRTLDNLVAQGLECSRQPNTLQAISKPSVRRS